MPALASELAIVGRRRLLLDGVVQGVGMRPYIYQLAREFGLDGWVRNTGAGVEVEIQGAQVDIEQFSQRVLPHAPPGAQVTRLTHADLTPHSDEEGFAIRTSLASATTVAVQSDVAPCEACLRELFDPTRRRYRYPFITCAQCGPRYSITRRLPYDREHTSLADFSMCPACAREYYDPRDRRFHAQAYACSECGPRLRFHDSENTAYEDPIAAATALIAAGGILAVKGVGGFHLLCDARNAAAVNRLRERKRRPHKPFAVMLLNEVSAATWVNMSAQAADRLASPERPILLCPKRGRAHEAVGGDLKVADVATSMSDFGVMLPSSPLHYLLWYELAGRPADLAWRRQASPWTLVCTSANRGGEPVLIDDQVAVRKLAGIADGFLLHDRGIARRCDDSVLRQHGDEIRWVRRARGAAPRPILLAQDGPPVLALGGLYKTTVCMLRDQHAYVSPHIGDVDGAAASRALVDMAQQWQELVGVQPKAVAHDLHPDFYTTRYAQHLAAHWGVPSIAVQHHHAHIAAVLAEQGIAGPVLGVALDGVGYGRDLTPWGGELLRVEGADCVRVGHFSPLPLPGGDRATREPWRIAAALLQRAGRAAEIEQRFPAVSASMYTAVTNHPLTTSAGRCFDVAAALLGVVTHVSYEGQAAMWLEAQAERHGEVNSWREGYVLSGDSVLDFSPLLLRLAAERDAGYGAALFHATLSAGIIAWACQVAEAQGLRRIVLNGGCFMNRLLGATVMSGLVAAGYDVHMARRLPPNDGGLSLGQAWVARYAYMG